MCFSPLLSQTHPPHPEELPLVIPRRGALAHGESPSCWDPVCSGAHPSTPPCQAVTEPSVPEPY